MRLKKLLKLKSQLKGFTYFITAYIVLMITLTGLIEVYNFMNYQENTYTFINPVQAREIKEEIILREVKSETIREVTMYTSTPEQTDSSPCIGASGQDQCVLWRNGQNICATNAFSRNTVLHVDGLGECLVIDTMNSRYKNRIDWYAGYDDECLDGVDVGDDCPNYKRAVKFGKQNLKVASIK